MRLFRALACEKGGCGLGEHEADGQIGVVREGMENVGDFDGCY